uniref:Putative ovule protein n=1 Tax=Solanum chacoense TaxID=4108 RepID=A0A0V0GXS8_SOLCH
MHTQNNLPTLVDPFPVSLISKAAEDRPPYSESEYKCQFLSSSFELKLKMYLSLGGTRSSMFHASALLVAFNDACNSERNLDISNFPSCKKTPESHWEPRLVMEFCDLVVL